MKYVLPSVDQTAFNCPHCGALTTQYWHTIEAIDNEKENPLPVIVKNDDDRGFEDIEQIDLRERLLAWQKKMKRGLPFLEKHEASAYYRKGVMNLNLSKCFNCNDIAIWIYDKLVYPKQGLAPAPNPDLPDEIRRDYGEASAILDLSPRGAAALIRLCIQKLCKHLGKPGENINSDIAALVRDGLDVRVQKALDAVRVIGNSAVHPGKIDLRDDRATAESLFRLLNLIADKMISEPKHVDDVYDMLPPGAKAQIEARDKS